MVEETGRRLRIKYSLFRFRTNERLQRPSILNCRNGVLPSANSTNEENSKSELFYISMTRAKDFLEFHILKIYQIDIRIFDFSIQKMNDLY